MRSRAGWTREFITYRVSLIDGPDGRVIETDTYDRLIEAETNVLRLCKLAGADQLVVFEREGGDG